MSRATWAVIGLGVYIILCSVVAFALAEFDWEKAKTAVLAGGGSGLLTLLVGLAALKLRPAVYLGVALTGLLEIGFITQAVRAYTGERPTYLIITFVLLSIGSSIALVVQILGLAAGSRAGQVETTASTEDQAVVG